MKKYTAKDLAATFTEIGEAEKEGCIDWILKLDEGYVYIKDVEINPGLEETELIQKTIQEAILEENIHSLTLEIKFEEDFIIVE